MARSYSRCRTPCISIAKSRESNLTTHPARLLARSSPAGLSKHCQSPTLYQQPASSVVQLANAVYACPPASYQYSHMCSVQPPCTL